LDYIAVGKNRPEKVADIVKGVAEGCIASGCALIGGETAEMPGFYPDNEYDLAGFAVGVVDKSKIIDGKRITEGDKLVGIASSGLHSNGFSLVRKLLNPTKEKMREHVEALGTTLGEELIKPTKIYVKTVLNIRDKCDIKGISHITGGGFIENIPRMIPQGLRVKIKRDSWPVLPIFSLMQKIGNLDENNMFNTFNMGIGLVIAAESSEADKMLKILNEEKEEAFIIGEVVKGEAGLEIC
jgi:phosphoribosylformylglycinamidine cyclo-ligase